MALDEGHHCQEKKEEEKEAKEEAKKEKKKKKKRKQLVQDNKQVECSRNHSLS